MAISTYINIKNNTRRELRLPEDPPISKIHAEDLYNRFGTDNSPALLLDVRTHEEYFDLFGHIKNSKLMPIESLPNNVSLLKEYKDKEIVIICHGGGRSMMAANYLARAGFKDLRILNGGMRLWIQKGYPVIENINLAQT